MGSRVSTVEYERSRCVFYKACSEGDKARAKRAWSRTFASYASKFGYSPRLLARCGGHNARGYDIMSASLLRAAGLVTAALFAVGTLDCVREQVAPGLHAEEARPANPLFLVCLLVCRLSRQETVEAGSSPGEIARYFQLYGGYIDPYINKQSPGGPFDSGFFFDSGIGPNGGDSPYMN